jgi:hypothetical protein
MRGQHKFVVGVLLLLASGMMYAKTETGVKPMVTQSTYMQQLNQLDAQHAILNMAGEYQVSFRFEELYSSKTDYQLKAPDVSKASEVVIVLENTPNKIVLQHLLLAGDHVVKHWRQDWEYEPTTMWEYVNGYQWQMRKLSVDETKGKWLQTVWQVDDSPRYASLGNWTSNHGVLAWTSEDTYRPLPRRELTTRDDYDTLTGINRQVITANGWVHEQDNIKFDAKTQKAIAREHGINVYKRVTDVDFKPAYTYWENNKEYWSVVRETWKQAFEQNERLGLAFTRQKDDDKKAHYVQFMKQAKEYASKDLSHETLEPHVKQLLNEQLTLGKLK